MAPIQTQQHHTKPKQSDHTSYVSVQVSTLPTRGSCCLCLLPGLLWGFAGITGFAGRAPGTQWHIPPMLRPQAVKHSCSSCAAAPAVLRSDYVVGTADLCCCSAGAALMRYDWVGALKGGTGCEVGAVGGLGAECRRRLARQREGGKDDGLGHVSLYAEQSSCLGTAQFDCKHATWVFTAAGAACASTSHAIFNLKLVMFD